jgi:hypothetical protein
MISPGKRWQATISEEHAMVMCLFLGTKRRRPGQIIASFSEIVMQHQQIHLRVWYVHSLNYVCGCFEVISEQVDLFLVVSHIVPRDIKRIYCYVASMCKWIIIRNYIF